MLALSNHELTAQVLDPADPIDRLRQGSRYCWGGYVWQVVDSKVGPLLAGPEWPEAAPRAFNGQGLPESFRHAEFGTGKPLILENGRGFIIGVGDVEPGVKEPVVTQPCAWTITRGTDSLEFCTSHAGHGYACQLTRRLTLHGRTLGSATVLTNTGNRPLPLHWFAHPFFALTDRLLTCALPASWDMKENPGYAFDAHRRLYFKRRFENIDDGHFEPLVIGPSTPLRCELSHPTLQGLTFSSDFVPDFCPIWGNSNTWSIEPYLVTELAPGTKRTWSVKYAFGTPARRA